MERTDAFHLWLDCHNSRLSTLNKLESTSSRYLLSRKFEWEVAVFELSLYVRGCALAVYRGVAQSPVKMWSLQMNTLKSEATSTSLSTPGFSTTLSGVSSNINQILRFLIANTDKGATRFSEFYENAQYYPLESLDLRETTIDLAEHAVQQTIDDNGAVLSSRLVHKQTAFDELFVLLHFRPCRRNLLDTTFTSASYRTMQEFSFTLSSLSSPKNSVMNPYIQLTQLRRLEEVPNYEWRVAVTALHYTPSGGIDDTIYLNITYNTVNRVPALVEGVECNFSITLAMLCNVRNKLAPYVNNVIATAIEQEKPATCVGDLPTCVLAFTGTRWSITAKGVDIDYQNSGVVDVGDFLGKVFGFDPNARTTETRIDTTTQTSVRTASVVWQPQLCESLYVRAPNIVLPDEFVVYNGNAPTTVIRNVIHRTTFDSDEVVDPDSVFLLMHNPTYHKVSQLSHSWFDVELVLALARADSIYDKSVQSLIRGVTNVTLTFRLTSI